MSCHTLPDLSLVLSAAGSAAARAAGPDARHQRQLADRAAGDGDDGQAKWGSSGAFQFLYTIHKNRWWPVENATLVSSRNMVMMVGFRSKGTAQVG